MEPRPGYMKIVIEINSEQTRAGMYGKHVKWTTYFKSTEEIEETLRNLDLEKVMVAVNYRLVSGYAYIGSFIKQVQSGRQLSDKQMVQCKRLASEIHKAKLLMNYIY